jgi:hypothetical protein
VKLSPSTIVSGAIAIVVLGGAGLEYRAWRTRHDALTADIARYRTGLQDRDRELEGKARIRRELSRFAETALGIDEETVTATVRTALNEIIAHYGLTDTTVSSQQARGVKNPAADARVTEFSGRRVQALRDRPDFLAISATVAGTGTLEQVIRVMATLEAQPWVHRIDKFSLRPVGAQRDRAELNVIFSTIYIPERDQRTRRDESGEGQLVWRPIDEAEFAAWRPIVTRNVLKEPAPDPAAPAAPAAVAEASAPSLPPRPAPPYEDWRVSGIARGVNGVEIMLVNDKTSEWKTLGVGGTVLDAKFIDAAGEVARLAIGEAVFEVRQGQRLSERKLVGK